ncbi:MAG: hypothetical protein R2713_23700 [Ilumatobacteraceae bacterium]
MRVLGPVSLVRDGGGDDAGVVELPSATQRRLLALLAMQQGPAGPRRDPHRCARPVAGGAAQGGVRLARPSAAAGTAHHAPRLRARPAGRARPFAAEVLGRRAPIVTWYPGARTLARRRARGVRRRAVGAR